MLAFVQLLMGPRELLKFLSGATFCIYLVKRAWENCYILASEGFYLPAYTI